MIFTFSFYNIDIHKQDYSRLWVGAWDNLPKKSVFMYQSQTLPHIKETFNMEIPKNVVGNSVPLRDINYCVINYNGEWLHYFVNPQKTEITQNNYIFDFERDNYIMNKLHWGLSYTQYKGILPNSSAGVDMEKRCVIPFNELTSSYKRLGSTTSALYGIQPRMADDGFYAYYVFKILKSEPQNKLPPYSNPNFIHCWYSTDYRYDSVRLASQTTITYEGYGDNNTDLKFTVECVKMYFIPYPFFMYLTNEQLNATIKVKIGSTYLHQSNMNGFQMSSKSLNHFNIKLNLFNGDTAEANKRHIPYENIYFGFLNKQWKINTSVYGYPYAYTYYNVSIIQNSSDISIIINGDFNNNTNENIEQYFEESFVINSGTLQLLQNENLRKTNKMYQGIGVATSVVGGVVNGITNPASILGGVNGIINSTKGMVTDNAREQDIKNQTTSNGNSGGLANIAYCNIYQVPNPSYSNFGFFIAKKDLTTTKSLNSFYAQNYIQYGVFFEKGLNTTTTEKPHLDYYTILGNLSDTMLTHFYGDNVTSEERGQYYMRYQEGLNVEYKTYQQQDKKFENALANGITFYGRR